MSGRPTHASVTEVLCDCKYLQRAADNPAVPIIFDERTNEYHFVYQEPGADGPASLNIYHCPFCGGAAPSSTRCRLFHVISAEEQRRLAELLVPMQSISDIVETLGAPDQDDPVGMCGLLDESDGAPSEVVPCRVLTFKTLSGVADVRVYERPDGTIGWSLLGKYIGV